MIDKDIGAFLLPQYPIVTSTETHMIHASCSSYMIDVSCKKHASMSLCLGPLSL